jgi:hypothetical protein
VCARTRRCTRTRLVACIGESVRSGHGIEGALRRGAPACLFQRIGTDLIFQIHQNFAELRAWWGGAQAGGRSGSGVDDDESTLPPSLPPPASLLHPSLPRDSGRLRRPGDLEADALRDADCFGMLPAHAQPSSAFFPSRAPRPTHTQCCSSEAAPDASWRRITGSRTTEHTGWLGHRCLRVPFFWCSPRGCDKAGSLAPGQKYSNGGPGPGQDFMDWVSFEIAKTFCRTNVIEKPHSTKKKLARGCARIAIMPGGMDSTGLAVGLKKGFIVEKRKLPVKPSTRKGVRALDSPPLPCVRANKPYLGRFALCAVRACSWGVRAEPEQLAGSQTPPMQNTVDRPWPGQRRCTATGAPCSHREAPYGSRSSAAEGSVGRRNARQGGTMGGAVHRAGSGALVLRVPGEPAVRGQGAIAGELLDWMWALVSVGIDEVRDADERACLCCVQQKLGKQVKLVRDIVREIAGVSPLERRGMELLKNGRDKRVLKLCKKRVRYISPSHPAHPSVSMHFFYPLCSKSLFRQRGAPTFPVQKKNLLWGKKECGGITGGGSL